MRTDKVIDGLRSLDPGADAPAPSEVEWRSMFEAIVESAPRGRRLWRRPVVTIPVFIALTGLAFLLTTAIAGDKVIEVAAADALRDPRAVERDLAREGIDARIVAVPSDNLAGKWFHLYLEPRSDIDLDTYWLLKSYVGLIDYRYPSVVARCPMGDCARTGLLELPGKVRGPITLVVGREPNPGEEFWAKNAFGMNELAPSGALWCYRLEEKTPAEAEEILSALGYDIVWVHENDARSDPVARPPAGALITTAWFRGPSVVDVRTAAPEDAVRYKNSEGTPTAEHPRSSAPWAPDC